MSFTKIPNFSNCNIWLPLQQLNIVMKYHHTRVKSTSFSKFYLHFFHLYIGKMLSIHFFFISITQATLVLLSTLPTSSSPPPPIFLFILDEKARKVQKCSRLHRCGELFKPPVIMRLLICQLDRGLSLSFFFFFS